MLTLQTEIGAWCLERFGRGPDNRDLFQDVLAIAEEAGEVCRAVLKRERLARGGTYEDWTANLRDELGDLFITILSLAHQEGFPIAKLHIVQPPQSGHDDPFRNAVDMLSDMGRLVDRADLAACGQAFTADGVDCTDILLHKPLADMLQSVQSLCVGEGWDPLEVIADRWAEVRERPYSRQGEQAAGAS